MPPSETNVPGHLPHSPIFATTRWSMVLSAGELTDTTRTRDALSRLCQTYWYPLYAYVRRKGHNATDAQDLTQAFFEQLLRRQALASADPERGRFRSFLLTAMNNFLTSEWKKGMTQKRGGACESFSLDWAAAEERYDLEPSAGATPDQHFDKQWAVTLLGEVVSRLEREFETEGKGALFAAIKESLLGRGESQPYTEIGTTLGMNESAVKVAVHRLRKRYRELVRAEVVNTLDVPGDVDAEMRHLFQALAG